MTCKHNWFLFNTRGLFGKSFPDYTCTDWSLFLICSMHSVFTLDLPVLLFHYIFVMASIAVVCCKYLLWYTRVTSVKWKKKIQMHTHRDTKNKQKPELAFAQKSILCCVACELLVSIVFDFQNSPLVFFLKPSSLLGSAALNGKMVWEDKAVPLTAAQKFFLKRYFS